MADLITEDEQLRTLGNIGANNFAMTVMAALEIAVSRYPDIMRGILAKAFCLGSVESKTLRTMLDLQTTVAVAGECRTEINLLKEEIESLKQELDIVYFTIEQGATS